MGHSSRKRLEPPRVAVAYLRKSIVPGTSKKYTRRAPTSKKKDDGREVPSIEQQRKNLRALAKAERVKVLKWFDDPGRRGWQDASKRPGFRSMFEYIERNRNVDCLLLDDLDRLSRLDYYDALGSIHQLVKWGVKTILSVNDGEFAIADQNNPAVAHVLTAKIQAAAESSRKTARRIAAAKRGDIENGRRAGGPVPLGMRWESSGVLAPGDPKEQKIVREIFQRFADGDSYGRIATSLNARKVPSPLGAKWGRTTVRRIIANDCYAGRLAGGRWSAGTFARIDDSLQVRPTETKSDARIRRDKPLNPVPAWKPVVDPKLWDACERRRAKMAKDKRARAKRGKSPLSGVLFCGQCGSQMHHRKNASNGRVYFVCGGGTHAEKDCRQYQIREDLALPLLLAALRDRLLENIDELQAYCPDEVRRALCATDTAAADELRRLREEHDAIKRRVKEVAAEMFDLDADGRAAVKEAMKAKQAEAGEIQQRIDELEAGAGADEMTAEERAALLTWFEERKGIIIDSWKVPGDDLVETETADAEKVNACLRDLGVECRVYHETVWRGKRKLHVPRQIEVRLGGESLACFVAYLPSLAPKHIIRLTRPITIRLVA